MGRVWALEAQWISVSSYRSWTVLGSEHDPDGPGMCGTAHGRSGTGESSGGKGGGAGLTLPLLLPRNPGARYESSCFVSGDFRASDLL